MSRRRREKKTKNPLIANRVIWLIFLVGVGIFAWISGERILYISLAVLLLLPVVSYILTFVALRRLHVRQSVPASVMKTAPSNIDISMDNSTIMPFGSVECICRGEEFVVDIKKTIIMQLGAFKYIRHQIPFQIMYRGHYNLGLEELRVTDMTGLFRMRRKYRQAASVTALPLVPDLSHFPLAMNLMTQAHSRFDIKDEDYATVSDIRPYLPGDSIKRVHWKLTAKRNEWLVKIFQSNALNHVSILLDSSQLPIHAKELYALEDRMVEATIGLAKFCLNRGMPVDFKVTEGHTTSARNPAEFELIYSAAGRLRFEPEPALDCLTILSHVLNDATGYINAVIATARLDAELYDRIVNAVNNGHYIAVMYFPTIPVDHTAEKIVKLLTEGGMPCFRVERGDT